MDTPISPSAAPGSDPGTSSQRAPGYDVFISHSSKDKVAADAVCHALESRNIRCWIAPRDIRPGMNWGEAILSGLSGARIMALLLSSNANASPQIEREVERAVHHNLIVIPVRLEEVAPGASLEYFLSTSHWLDAFQGPLNVHLERLADTVQSILTGQPAAPRAVAAPVVQPAGATVPPRAVNSSRTGLIVGAVAGAALLIGAAVWWFTARPAPTLQNSIKDAAKIAPAGESSTANEDAASGTPTPGTMDASPTPEAEDETSSPSPAKE